MADGTQDDTFLLGGYQPVTLATERGEIRCRVHAAPGAERGVVWAGGVGGGWDSPARDLFPRLAEELAGEDIASLRVRYRHPTDLAESVFDVLAGLQYLETQGVRRFGLVGHSFGGAVVIQAAAKVPAVTAVATLATQGYGAGPAATLGPRAALLLIHGKDDEVLPCESTEHVHRLARDPKRMVLFSGARHGLDEVGDRVHREVRDWLLSRI
ncbi:alpha/beta hydrolase [Rhodospirillum centenum]|uniref:Dienelactone hydrolase domain-containing protein n=1 Tax=Rhodospirillum centenum (strain ATCC 51521 / SW) TaxID=414684 RepID=B6IP52_RHOCS|nr:dienelactone hydrolase family protein [Rhodospirillum centenum]ACI99554.1 conserved hypothetical protein [Rhodospirillum centenum SW]